MCAHSSLAQPWPSGRQTRPFHWGQALIVVTVLTSTGCVSFYGGRARGERAGGLTARPPIQQQTERDPAVASETQTLTRRSLSGRIAYHSYSAYMAAPVDETDGHSVVYRLDEDSELNVTAAHPIENAMNPHFSPDGGTLTFMAIPRGAPRTRASLEVYLLRLANQELIRLTADQVPDEDPKFSPDGQRLVWKRDNQIWVMDVDGQTRRQLTQTEGEKSGPMFSADGSRIVYWLSDGANADLASIPSEGGEPGWLVRTPGVQDYYPIVWDAERVLYARWASAQDHHDEIHVVEWATGLSRRMPFNEGGVETSDAFGVTANVLGFSSTRPGGEGDYDLYIAVLHGDAAEVLALPGANSPHRDLGGTYSPTE